MVCISFMALLASGCESSLSGHVSAWPDGAPVAGAQIDLWQSDCDWEVVVTVPLPTDCRRWSLGVVATDANGDFVHADAPSGETLKLIVSKEGFLYHEQLVEVGEGVAVQLLPNPPSPATDVRATGLGPDGIRVTWVNPTESNFAGVLLAREPRDSTPNLEPPAQTLDYHVGDSMGASRVVYVGTGTASVDTDVTHETHYYYRVISFSNHHVYAVAALDDIAFDAVPPEAPTGVSVEAAGPWAVTVRAWVPDDIEAIVVFRSVDRPLDHDPEFGNEYHPHETLGNGSVVGWMLSTGVSSTREIVDGDPPTGVLVYYTLLAFDQALNYSGGTAVSIQR
jgi:hypothetical protein